MLDAGSAHRKFQYIINNISGSTAHLRTPISGNLSFEFRATLLVGSTLNGDTPSNHAKYTFTYHGLYGRTIGADNHENQPPHLDCGSFSFLLPGYYTLGFFGSLFLLPPQVDESWAEQVEKDSNPPSYSGVQTRRHTYT